MDGNSKNNIETTEVPVQKYDGSGSGPLSTAISNTNVNAMSINETEATNGINNNREDPTTLIDWQRKCMLQNKEIERLNKLNKFLELERRSRQ